MQSLVTYLERDQPYTYYVSKGLAGWFEKMAVFAEVQYCIYVDIVGG